MSLWESIFGYCESTGGLWESILGLYESILSLWGSILGLWESISGFGNQFRPQDFDVGHLVIDFGPVGVNFGLYRILQMICLENLIREFTNENMCIRRGIWVNFLCLLSENLSKINPIYESFLSSGVDFGPLEVILVTGIRF